MVRHITVMTEKDTDTPFDVSPTDTPWETTAHHIVALAAGGRLDAGPYTLWFNKDGEGYWHLHSDDGTTHWSVLFDGVWLPDGESFALEDHGTTCLVLDGVPDVAPKLAGVLAAIAGGDPSHHFPVVDDSTDNYYDVIR